MKAKELIEKIKENRSEIMDAAKEQFFASYYQEGTWYVAIDGETGKPYTYQCYGYITPGEVIDGVDYELLSFVGGNYVLIDMVGIFWGDDVNGDTSYDSDYHERITDLVDNYMTEEEKAAFEAWKKSEDYEIALREDGKNGKEAGKAQWFWLRDNSPAYKREEKDVLEMYWNRQIDDEDCAERTDTENAIDYLIKKLLWKMKDEEETDEGKSNEIIVVTSQEELDVVPENYKDWLNIQFGTKDDPAIVRGNKKAIVYGENYVEAHDRSKITVFSGSIIKACDESIVWALGTSKVKAFDRSEVKAFDESIIEAHDRSEVTAQDDSLVKAWEHSVVIDLYPARVEYMKEEPGDGDETEDNLEPEM